MASPTVDLDRLQQELLAFLPLLALSALCCCRIVETNLSPNEHLDGCELLSIGGASSVRSSEGASDTSSNTGTPREESSRSEQRKKHRESMARLRHGWRASIAALQHQEEKLHGLLCRLIAVPSTTSGHLETTSEATMSPLQVLRASYRELVEEQLRLEEQRAGLEDAKAHRDKYERLLQRELVRIRLYYVSDSNS